MSKPTSQEIGQERLKGDKRQLGGLLMLIGVNALVFPMANVASRIGPPASDTTANQGIPLCSLIAGVFVIMMGVMSIPIGYMQAVHDYGHKYLTGFLILWGQLAWMPFLTDLTDVGKGARSGAAFIPEAYDPSDGDVKFVGAMGMMGILGYGTGFLGSLAFIQFSLFAFQSGKPGDRPGSYYKGRLTFYSFCLFMVGLSQLLLGAFVLKNVSSGPLPNGPVAVAMYMVHFPEISIFVGLFQVLNAMFGMARSVGIHNGETDHLFQFTTLFQWVCMISMQILVQVSYAPGGAAAAAAPSQTMITMGVNVIVAYLDFKMRSTPDVIPADYYGLDGEEEDGQDGGDGDGVIAVEDVKESTESKEDKEEVASEDVDC